MQLQPEDIQLQPEDIQAACLKKRMKQQPVSTISKHNIQIVKVIDAIPQV